MSYSDAFAFIVGVEGKLSLDPKDRGNWTGGKVGVGILKGTKYGVSAAAYPLLDIANLSLSDAQSIFKRDFWDKIAGDALPYGTALLIGDFGYNSGISEAVRTAQRAIGETPDGVLGPRTLGALQAHNPGFAIAFTSYRIVAYSQMALWQDDGHGWTTRAIAAYTKAIA